MLGRVSRWRGPSRPGRAVGGQAGAPPGTGPCQAGGRQCPGGPLAAHRGTAGAVRGPGPGPAAVGSVSVCKRRGLPCLPSAPFKRAINANGCSGAQFCRTPTIFFFPFFFSADVLTLANPLLNLSFGMLMKTIYSVCRGSLVK